MLHSWWLKLFNYCLEFCGEKKEGKKERKKKKRKPCVFVWKPRPVEHGEALRTLGLCDPLRVTLCSKEDSQHMHMFPLFMFLFIGFFFNGTSYCNLVNSHLKSRHHPVALKVMIFIFYNNHKAHKLQSKPLHLYFFFVTLFVFLPF